MFELRQSKAFDDLFFFHDANGDAVTGKVDGDFTKRISKNGAAFAAMTVTITERENGWYQFQLSTGHSGTFGVLSLTFTASGGKQVNKQYLVDRMKTNLDKVFNDETGVKVALDKLTIVAVTSNDVALEIVGDGSGEGIKVTGGSVGDGIRTIASSSVRSGFVAEGGLHGIVGSGDNNGSGMALFGDGSGAGLDINGALSGPGVAILGGVISGKGIDIKAGGGNADGVTIAKTGTGKDVTGGFNMDRIAGDSDAATNQKNAALHVFTVTLQNGPHTTTSVKTNATEQTTNHYRDRQLYFRTGVLAGQKRDITGYSWDGSNGVFTIDATTDIPVDADLAEVI